LMIIVHSFSRHESTRKHRKYKRNVRVQAARDSAIKARVSPSRQE
jgi:hypothetical protein